MICLSILIATIGQRNASFVKLVEHLMRQADPWPIEVIAYWNNGEKSIGHIRQALLEEAKGEYVCFIDDDDWVPDWYCEEIMAALGEDYVGFRVELFEQERQMKPVFHSLKYGGWHEDEQAFYRSVTHLNPIRRELAVQGVFGKQGAGEDASWAKSLEGIPKTEKYIDRVMYYYYHDADQTMFGGAHQPKATYKRPDLDHAKFRYHPDSKEYSE